MVTVTLDEITLNAVKAALDERIKRLESEIRGLNVRASYWADRAFEEEAENLSRALVWNIAALHETKMAREYLGDPEVLVDHPVHATYEVDPEFNPGYVMGPGDEVPRFDPDWNREGQPEFNGSFR